MTQALTHSRLACFRRCPRQHWIRYELGIRPERDSVPLRVGSAFHAAIEAADLGQDVEAVIDGSELDPFEAAIVAAMFDGHQRRWADDQLEVVESEMEFDIPLINPDTGKSTPIWRLRGKQDRIVRLADGRLALMEHKTTTHDTAPGSDYWMKLRMDSQLSIYVIAARAMGFDVETVLYNVTRRPMLKPKKATPEESKKYKADGSLYKSCREHDELPEEFAVRVAESIAANPEKYFVRNEIARLDQDLDDCKAELWAQQLQVRDAQKSGRWYRNPESCVGMFKCEFLAVCQNRDLGTHTPRGFTRSEDIHPELSGCATDEC